MSKLIPVKDKTINLADKNQFHSSFCFCSCRQIKLHCNYVVPHVCLADTCTSFVKHQTKDQMLAVGKLTQTYKSSSAVISTQ